MIFVVFCDQVSIPVPEMIPFSEKAEERKIMF